MMRMYCFFKIGGAYCTSGGTKKRKREVLDCFQKNIVNVEGCNKVLILSNRLDAFYRLNQDQLDINLTFLLKTSQ